MPLEQHREPARKYQENPTQQSAKNFPERIQQRTERPLQGQSQRERSMRIPAGMRRSQKPLPSGRR